MPSRRSRPHLALPLLFALAIAGVMSPPREMATLPTAPQTIAQTVDGRKAEGDCDPQQVLRPAQAQTPVVRQIEADRLN